MGQQERPDGEPSLELPSFGLRRRRRKASRTPEPTDSPDTPASPPPPPEPVPPPPPTEPEPEPGPEPEPEPTAPADRAAPGGMPAAVLTGGLVGVLAVGLTWGALRLCEVVRGTSSCGRPGFFLLLAILIVVVLLGKLVLRSLRVDDPGSTSLLGVGLVAVVSLLFLADLLFQWWMVLVVPIVGATAFALSHWVTQTYTEPASPDDMHR